MYSVVLIAALAASPSAPAWHHHSCSGCYGCCGGCFGCSGCYGCCGGCFGCCGGCWGGCGGGCFGCGGGACYGDGCCGGCFGCSGCYGCGGCYGEGGYGGAGYGDGPYGDAVESVAPAYEGGPVLPSTETGGREAAPAPRKKISGADKDDKDQEEVSADRGRLMIEVPTDAKLYIDGRPMRAGSTHRSFTTPALETGQSYYYDVRAEVTRDGQTLTQTWRLIVQAGGQARASFKEVDAQATAKADADGR